MADSIDTSGLTYAWRDHYPPDVFPILWETMAEAIDQADIIASWEVYEELKVGADELFDWVNLRKHMFVPTDEKIQESVSEVMAAHPLWVSVDRSRNMCDPFVIALARIGGYTVVSAELRYSGNLSQYPDRVKIPNVCSTFGLRHLSFLEMMRDAKWNFAR